MYVADGGFKSAASAKRFCQVAEFSPVAISPDRERHTRTPAILSTARTWILPTSVAAA